MGEIRPEDWLSLRTAAEMGNAIRQARPSELAGLTLEEVAEDIVDAPGALASGPAGSWPEARRRLKARCDAMIEQRRLEKLHDAAAVVALTYAKGRHEDRELTNTAPTATDTGPDSPPLAS